MGGVNLPIYGFQIFSFSRSMVVRVNRDVVRDIDNAARRRRRALIELKGTEPKGFIIERLGSSSRYPRNDNDNDIF